MTPLQLQAHQVAMRKAVRNRQKRSDTIAELVYIDERRFQLWHEAYAYRLWEHWGRYHKGELRNPVSMLAPRDIEYTLSVLRKLITTNEFDNVSVPARKACDDLMLIPKRIAIRNYVRGGWHPFEIERKDGSVGILEHPFPARAEPSDPYANEPWCWKARMYRHGTITVDYTPPWSKDGTTYRKYDTEWVSKEEWKEDWFSR